jgi:hypothetical protein
MTDTGDTKVSNKGAQSKDPGWYRVVSSFPQDQGKVLFRSVSETRARRYLTNRFPRGSEAHLRLPDGSHEHYEHERQGEHGQDAEQWAPFDPESWKPPAEQEPPGQSAWGDVEG